MFNILFGFLKTRIGVAVAGASILAILALYFYINHVVSENKQLHTKVLKYKDAVKGWELAYISLEKNQQKIQDLLHEKIGYINSIETLSSRLRKEVQKTEEDNDHVKNWFNQTIPDSVIKLRSELRNIRQQERRLQQNLQSDKTTN